MELKNCIIYYPDGKNTYHEVGQKLLDKDQKETDISINKITEENGKIIIEISNGEKYLYALPYSSKLNELQSILQRT